MTSNPSAGSSQVTGEQLMALLARLVPTTQSRFQVLIKHWPFLQHIADGGLAPGEIRRLSEERYLPLSDFDADERWTQLQAQLTTLDIDWRRLYIFAGTDTYLPLHSYYNVDSRDELEQYWEQDHTDWFIRMAPAR